MKFCLAIVLLLRAVSVCPAGDCEVCVGFLQRVYGSLVSTHQDLSPALVEEELVSACAEVQGKESRLCYYLGASSDAATRVTASVARPLASHVPVDKICQRLGGTDKQICELKYGNFLSEAKQEAHRNSQHGVLANRHTHAEQQLWDLSSAGLLSLRVAELKRVLSSWGEECRGCLEKHEFVDLIQEKAQHHQHDQHELHTGL